MCVSKPTENRQKVLKSRPHRDYSDIMNLLYGF